MSEFKPGDVVFHPGCGRGIVQDVTVRWGARGGFSLLRDVDDDLRRLVVIDPDNEGDTDLLGDILEIHEWQPKPRSGAYDSGKDLADALRYFADPKPPKPDEPTGLGAVVEDAEGGKWVRIVSSAGWWWRSNRTSRNLRWSAVDAVRVLSEGVQP